MHTRTLQQPTLPSAPSSAPSLGDEWVPCWAQTRRPLSQKSRSSASRPPSSVHSNVQSTLQMYRYIHTDDHGCLYTPTQCSSQSWGRRVKQEIFPGDITHHTFVLPHQSTEISPSQLLQVAVMRMLMTVSFVIRLYQHVAYMDLALKGVRPHRI